MDISVVKRGSVKHKEFNFGATVVQRNRNPSAIPSKRCILKDGLVGTWVPACIAGVVSQTGGGAFQELAKSYEMGIRVALSVGATVIEVEQFGVGSGHRVSTHDGKHKYSFGLYWKAADSARAAKTAVQALTGIAEGVIVVFTIPDEYFEEWDHIMRF
tara:strand:- start:179 stop:652 length:474 start_codon:yes stop_codon:yes gene_type:complete